MAGLGLHYCGAAAWQQGHIPRLFDCLGGTLSVVLIDLLVSLMLCWWQRESLAVIFDIDRRLSEGRREGGGHGRFTVSPAW
jgi:hypothetical protein